MTDSFESNSNPGSNNSPESNTEFADLDGRMRSTFQAERYAAEARFKNQASAPAAGRDSARNWKLWLLPTGFALGALALLGVIMFNTGNDDDAGSPTIAGQPDQPAPEPAPQPSLPTDPALDAAAEQVRLVRLDAGGNHTCAIDTEGRTLCWGDNTSFGALGIDPGVASTGAPVEVRDALYGVGVTAGSFHTCTLRGNGTVACWGSDVHGQLGNELELGSTTRPVVVSGLSEAFQIDTSGSHVCAIYSSDLLVACWGINRAGETGQPLGSSPLVDGFETSPTPIPVPLPAAVTDLAIGQGFSCALLADARVACWGDDPMNATDPASANIPVVVPELSGATTIDAGPTHLCGVVAGRVVCSGSWTGAPAIPEVDSAVDIAVGSEHACALLIDGSVVCWDLAVPEPTPVDGLADATAITAGYNHTCALVAAGDYFCWGDNDRGQLGTDQLAGPTVRPVLVVFPELEPLPEPPPPEPAPINTGAATSPVGEWRLLSYTVDGVTTLGPAEGLALTITPDGGLRVDLGCNGLGGTAAFDAGGTFVVSDGVQTETACREAAVMEREVLYAELLNGVTQWQIVDGRLELSGPGGQLSYLRGGPVATLPLAGATWVATAIYDEDVFANSTASDPTANTEPVTLSVSEDGTATIAADDCGSFIFGFNYEPGGEGNVAVADDIGPITCPDGWLPEAFELLVGSRSYVISGEKLTFSGPNSDTIGFSLTGTPQVAEPTPPAEPQPITPQPPTPVPCPFDQTQPVDVVGVAADDPDGGLVVHTAPDIASPEIGVLAWDAGNLVVIECAPAPNDAVWARVEDGLVSGWVNARFLGETQTVIDVSGPDCSENTQFVSAGTSKPPLPGAPGQYYALDTLKSFEADNGVVTCLRFEVFIGEGDSSTKSEADMLPDLSATYGPTGVDIRLAGGFGENFDFSQDRHDARNGSFVALHAHDGESNYVHLGFPESEISVRYANSPARVIVDIKPVDARSPSGPLPGGGPFIIDGPIHLAGESIAENEIVTVTGWGRPFESQGNYIVYRMNGDGTDTLVDEGPVFASWAFGWGEFEFQLRTDTYGPGNYRLELGEWTAFEEQGDDFRCTGQTFTIGETDPTSSLLTGLPVNCSDEPTLPSVEVEPGN